MAKTSQRKAIPDSSPQTKNGQRTNEKGASVRQKGSRPRLVLIEPGAPGKHIYSRLKLPRLGPVLLGTIAKDLGWDVRIFVEDVADIDYRVVLSADLVGISTITSTANRAYAMADAIREFGIPVVMGGPHVTFLADEALDHCDYVIRGEGERAFALFLAAIPQKKKMRKIPTLSFRDKKGRIRHNPMDTHIVDLDSLPYPDFDLIEGWENVRGFGDRRILPVQTSRGCPFGCRFCSVVGMFGRKMRHRSAEHVLGELEQHDNPKQHIFFYDDNFAANKRAAKQLIHQALLDRRRCTDWSAQVRTDAAKDSELMELMARSGCSHVYVGFESVNPKALAEMEKKQQVRDMREAIARFHDHNIGVHGMFVFGFDSDTQQTLMETTRFAVESEILSAQFLLLTPLPGTPLFDSLRSEHRLQTLEWCHFDGHHVTFRPNHLSSWQLQQAQIQAHARFYSKGRMVKQLWRKSVTGLFISHYARRLSQEWKRTNLDYLRALKLADRARGLRIRFDFEVDLQEIGRKVRLAAETLNLLPRSAAAPA